MQVSRRNVKIAIGASALALVAALWFIVYNHFTAIQVASLARAHDLVQSALEEALGRKVTIGAVTGAGLDSVKLADVAVSAGPGEGDGAPVFEVDEVVVNYSLLDVVFGRKPIMETVTSVSLVRPVARMGLKPDGGIWPSGLADAASLSSSAAGAFAGSVAVKDGRLEVSGIPGLSDVLHDAAVLDNIEGTLSVAGSAAGAALAWRASGRTGPKRELRLNAAGTFDLSQKALSCDVTLSGAMPAGVIDVLRQFLDERPDLATSGDSRPGPEVLAYIGAADEIALSGGRVDARVHIRPIQDGGRLIRGGLSIAGAEVSSHGPAPWVRTIHGTANLASEFQSDPSGFSCQGKVSVAADEAELDGSSAGLGILAGAADAVVEFWQRPGEEICFEGRADLDVPTVSLGDALQQALAGTVDGSAAGAGRTIGEEGAFDLTGPLDVSLSFAGRGVQDVELRGRVAMRAGHVVAKDLLPDLPELSGDIGWELDFSRSAQGGLAYSGKVRAPKASLRIGLIAGTGDFSGEVGASFAFSATSGVAASDGKIETPLQKGLAAALAAAQYEGEIEVISGSVNLSHEALGLTSAKGSVAGRVSFRGNGGGPSEYSGKLSVADATLAMSRPREGVKSLETGASGTVEFEGAYPGKARFRGSLELKDGGVAAEFSRQGVGAVSCQARTSGTVTFSGEYPGRIEYRGTMDASRGRLTVRNAAGGLARWETEAGAHVDFEGAHPGGARFTASCSFPAGEVEVVNGPAGIASAAGRVSGHADVSGSLPGSLEWQGRVSLEKAAVHLVNAPGGVESLSGVADVAVDIAGSSEGGLRYSGEASLLECQVAAANMPGGVRSLKGPARGSLEFAGTYPGAQELEGEVSVAGAELVMGEVPGFVKSLAGRATGRVAFAAKDGSVERYSGEATVASATFVADDVYPGVTTARGPVRLDVEFSSVRGGQVDLKGSAAISGAHLRGGRLFPGLDAIEGEVDASFDFETAPEGMEYEGTAEVIAGKAVLGSGMVPGVERLDGDIAAKLDFRGVGGKAGTYSGRATLAGGTLKAGGIAKGIELIEGPAGLEVAFSGGGSGPASFSGKVSLRDALFKAGEMVPGMKSVTGRMAGEVTFASKPDGSVSYEGTADLMHASFAAGAVYPGIKELGGNGHAHLTFLHSGGSGLESKAEITVARGVIAHDSIGSRIEDIAAEIAMTEDVIEIRGMTGRLGASRIEASGWLRLGKKVELDLAIKSRDLALADLGRVALIGAAGESASLSGSAAVDLRVRGYYPNLQYGGQMELKGVTVNHPRLGVPIAGVSGLISLSGKKIATESLTMTVAGFPVTARGEIVDPLDPRLDVTLTMAGLDIGSLAKAILAENGDRGRTGLSAGIAAGPVADGKSADFNRAAPIDGKGSIAARLSGTVDDIFVDGTVDLASLSFRVGDEGVGVTASGVKGSFRYSSGALTLGETRARFAGGSVTIEGALTPGRDLLTALENLRGPAAGGGEAPDLPAVRASVKLEGVSVAALGPLILPSGLPSDFDLSGTLDGDLVVAWGGQAGPRYEATGSCRVAGASIARGKSGFRFTNVEAAFRADGTKVAFQRIVARGPDGDIEASGTVSRSGAADLRVAMGGADLAKLAQVAGYEAARGVIGFAGRVSVRDGDVIADGLADVKDGTIGGIEFDSLTGKVTVSRGEARLESVGVRAGKASYVVSGRASVDGKSGSAIDLAVQLTGVPFQDVLSLARSMEGATAAVPAGDLPVTGVVSGQVVIRGVLANPEARGSVSVSSAELFGMKPERVTMDFALSKGVVHVERLEAKVGPAAVAMHGTMGSDGTLDLAVNADGIDLAQLPVPDLRGLPSNGSASFRGTVTGDLTNPQLEGQVSAANVAFGNIVVSRVAGTVRWTGNEIELAPLVIDDMSGQARAAGTISFPRDGDPSQGEGGAVVDLELVADSLALATVLDLVKPDLAVEASGKVTGNVTVKGDIAAPDVDVRIEASDLEVAGVAFATAVLDARSVRGELDIRVLRLRQEGGGYLEVSGTSSRGGSVSLMGSAKGFDAAVLASLIGLRYTVRGTLDLAAKIDGSSSQPSATVAMQLTNGVVERVKFDVITARMSYKDGAMTVEEGEIVQGRHRASVTGKVPLSGERLAGLGIAAAKHSGGLDVTVRMNDASLVMLMMLTDQIEWSEGTANVDLHITGSLEAPRFRGQATVSGGSVKLAPLEDSLRDLAARIVFEGAEASVEELTCRLGDGTVRVSGGVVFGGSAGGTKGPSVDLRVSSARALVNTGQLRALVDASLEVVGQASRPLLKGDIRLVKAEVSPSGLGALSLPVDADLDVTISTQDDLRIRTKTMDIPASGSIKASGTLEEPVLAGRVEAHRGWFAYFGNEFTVREAVADFREDGGIMPYLHVQAETHSGSTAIYLTLKGALPDNLALDLTSSPPLSREEILALLNYPGALAKILGGDMEGAMREELVRILDQELRLQLVGGIERAFEDALSLDEFRIQRGVSNELTLRIGKYVVDDLYLSYERGFGPQSAGVLRFDYLYGPGVVLTGKFDDRGMYTIGVEARLRF